MTEIEAFGDRRMVSTDMMGYRFRLRYAFSGKLFFCYFGRRDR